MLASCKLAIERNIFEKEAGKERDKSQLILVFHCQNTWSSFLVVAWSFRPFFAGRHDILNTSMMYDLAKISPYLHVSMVF